MYQFEKAQIPDQDEEEQTTSFIAKLIKLGVSTDPRVKETWMILPRYCTSQFHALAKLHVHVNMTFASHYVGR